MAELNLNVEGISADIEKFADIFGESVATQGKNIISRFAHEAMQLYYDEYPMEDHIMYMPRTNQMLNQSYKPFKKGRGVNSEGGVRIYSGNTAHPDTPHPKNWTEADIYEEVWERGYHGWQRVSIAKGDGLSADGKWAFARIGNGINWFAWVEKQVYSKQMKETIANKAYAEAKKAHYSVIHF